MLFHRLVKWPKLPTDGPLTAILRTSIFKPAYVVSATDIPYPIQSIAIGTVVLEVVVSETGKVDSVLPIREIDSLTEVAIDSVKNWKFRAARPSGCCCVAIPRSSGGLERRTAELRRVGSLG